MSEIESQIGRAEERWRKTAQKRRVARGELDKLDKKESSDWKRLDDRSRIARRLVHLGEMDAAEAVMDQTDTGFNPLERVLGASQLTGIEFFERGLIAARAVARIEIRGADGRLNGFGSGVLISPRLLLTNNHVLSNQAEAANSTAQFEYLTSAAGVAREPMTFGLRPDHFFVTDEQLDFTVVAVRAENDAGDPLADRGWCPLIAGSGKALVGERVNIIQHPGGERMQVTVRDNTIVSVVEEFLQYVADTRPGSSGSPVYNEQWEMAALHHAGVPKRDANGRILLKDGRPWNSSQDTDQIDWESNEGVRVSKIVAHISGIQLSPAWRSLWEQAFVLPQPPDLWDLFRSRGRRGNELLTNGAGGPVGQGVETDGTASWLFRLSFGPVGRQRTSPPAPSLAVNAPSGSPPITISTPPPIAPAAPTTRSTPNMKDAAERIVERFRHTGPYYDEADDRAAARAYYREIDWRADAHALFNQLHDLLEHTHTKPRGYSQARHEFLYPAVDLYEDGQLHNVYSGARFSPEEAIAKELALVVPRAEAMGLEVDRANIDALLERDDVWDALERESSGPAFNCEHVVCQSWFDKHEPMRGDLHHLFACEPGCNSFRSNIPYWEFDPEDEAERTACGRREGNSKFEPERGKGAVARATLYFLVRYPGKVGDRSSELTRDRMGVLLSWHRHFPVDRYEQHRNWLIHQAQGNRNPFIDRPDVASHALLRLGFGSG